MGIEKKQIKVSSNKRIVKNTLMMYFRMLTTLFVGLYTSRIVLISLGITDYGIYNVVGGVVVMFSLFSSTLGSASQRYFSFELGRSNYEKLNNLFSMMVTIYICLAFVIFILAETLGLWFLNSKMVFPIDRMEAVNWVYQFSIFSLMVSIISIPYNSLIIANEKMNIYAYISILDVIFKLLIVFFLDVLSFDKLKLYSTLVFAVSCFTSIIFIVYCRKTFKESYYKFVWDKSTAIELFSYSGWNIFGTVAVIGRNEGVNILLNIFFGAIINAARGITMQINTVLNNFATNFLVAVNPQITKLYALEEYDKVFSLVIRVSKYSFFLILLISSPILFETDLCLKLWLNIVPPDTILFVRLILINTMIDSISYSLVTLALATGKIKMYQIVVGGVLLLNIPLTYLFFELGYRPQITFIVSIFISSICLFLRVLMLNKIMDFPIYRFIKNVIAKICLIVPVVFILPISILYLLDESTLRLFAVTASFMISLLVTLYYLGINNEERLMLNGLIKSKIYSKFR